MTFVLKTTKRIGFAACVALLLLVASSRAAGAITGTIYQQVLPLDCVFESVNDGLGTIVYLTPEECGVIVTPPVDPGQTTPGPVGSSDRPQGTVIQNGDTIIYQLPFIMSASSTPSYTGANESVKNLPFSPVAAVSNTQAQPLVQNETSAVISGTVVVVGISSLLLLVLFILL